MVTRFEQLSNEIIMDLWEYMDLYSLWYGWFNLNHRFNQMFCDNGLRFKFNSNIIPDNDKHSFRTLFASVMPFVSSRLTSLTLAKRHQDEFTLICGRLQFDALKVFIFDETNVEGDERVSHYHYDPLEPIAEFVLNLKSLRNLSLHTGTIHGTKAVLAHKIICKNQLPKLTAFTMQNGYYNLELSYNNMSSVNTIKRLQISCEMNDLTAIFACSTSLTYLTVCLSDGWTYGSWIGRGKPLLPALLALREVRIGVQDIPFDDLSNIFQAMPNVECVEISGGLNDRCCYDGANLKHSLSNIKAVTIKKLQYRTVQPLSRFRFVNDQYWYNVKWEEDKRNGLILSALGGSHHQ